MMDMRTSSAGREIIKEFEQKRLRAYMPTPDDVPTIGFGHTKGVRMGMVITDEEAEQFLIEDCMNAEECINEEVRVPINQNQFDALVSFVFNVGSSAFRHSTLLTLLNQKRYQAAADQLLRWNKQNHRVLNGLTRRRKMERELFLTEE